jgi:ribosomal protein L4
MRAARGAVDDDARSRHGPCNAGHPIDERCAYLSSAAFAVTGAVTWGPSESRAHRRRRNDRAKNGAMRSVKGLKAIEFAMVDKGDKREGEGGRRGLWATS